MSEPTEISSAPAFAAANQGWMSNLPNLGADAPEPAPDAAAVKPELAADAKIPDRTPTKGPAKGADPRAQKADPADQLEADQPRNSKQWKEFKAARDAKEKELSGKLTDYETRIKEYEAKLAAPAAPAEDVAPLKEKLTAAEKRAAEMEDRLKLVGVEKHPQFIAYFTGKTNQQIDLATKIAGPEHAETVKRALALPPGEYRDSRITEIVEGMNTIQASRFGSVLNELDKIEQERAGEIANYATNYDKMTKAEKAAQEAAKQQQEAGYVKVYETVKANMEKSNPAFQKREGDAAWNAQVDARMAEAVKLLRGQVSPEEGVEAAHRAAAYPAVLQTHLAYVKESKEKIAQLEKQVAELSSAQPKLEGNRTATAADGKPVKQEIKPGMNPMHTNRAWMAGLPKLGQ